MLSEDLFLFQAVTEPTRFRANQNPSLFDLVFSSYSDNLSEIKTSAPIGKSDHVLLTFYTIQVASDSSVVKYKLKYSAADFNKLSLAASGLNRSDMERLDSTEDK